VLVQRRWRAQVFCQTKEKAKIKATPLVLRELAIEALNARLRASSEVTWGE